MILVVITEQRVVHVFSVRMMRVIPVYGIL